MKPIPILEGCLLFLALAGCTLESPRGSGPIMLSEQVEQAFEQYKNEENPKHFAVSLDGEHYGYSICPDFKCQSGGQKVALESCMINSDGIGCKIFASGRTVIWDGHVDSKATFSKALDIGHFSNVGLRNEEKIQKIVTQICTIEPTLSIEKLEDDLHKALLIGLEGYLPVPNVQFKQNLSSSGFFDYENWTIQVHGKFFHPGAFQNSLIEIAIIIFHETRHADQYFSAAKYRASLQSHSANKESFIRLPDKIVRQAAEQALLLTDEEISFGKTVYNDLMSPGYRKRKIFLVGELERTIKSGDYGAAYNNFYEELWGERDAAALEEPAADALEKCLLERMSLQGQATRLVSR